MPAQSYSEILISAIKNISVSQNEKLERAAEIIKKVIAADGLVHVFGCGHSHLLAEESFYRAGGLACINPIFYEPLMLHESAVLSSSLEKKPGLADSLLKRMPLESRDALICISTSGLNAVPVEFAMGAKKLCIPVIGISSDAYLQQYPERPHLQQVCDLCIDNQAPRGDACLDIPGLDTMMAPVSTITGCYIINSIFARAARLALAEGIAVPVFKSGNIPGGREFNSRLISRYQGRVKCL